MQALKKLIGAGVGCLWMFAGPATYVLSIVDTWRGHEAGWIKLLISLSLDIFLSAIWPITWVFWGVHAWLGDPTPLRLLF